MRGKLGAQVSRVIVVILCTLAVGLLHAWESGSRLSAERSEVDRLRIELKASQRATDVEYFARQCDREKRELLDRCACSCAEGSR